MLGVGHSSSTNNSSPAVDRTAYRQSWSSDEPTSSNASVSSRESKGLWSKLRKQASRLHVSHSMQPDYVPPMPTRAPRGSVSSTASSAISTMSTATGVHIRPHTMSAESRPQTADPRRTSTVGPVAATTQLTTADAREQLLKGVEGWERLKMIAAMDSEASAGRGDSGVARTNSMVMQPRRPAPPPPTMAASMSENNVRGSADLYRRPGLGSKMGASYSMDIPRTPNHSNPDEISAESIRLTLGAYTGKSETKGRPRLRRLMMLPTGSRRPQSRDHSQNLAALGLECIAEDEEQPVHVHGQPSSDGANLPLQRTRDVRGHMAATHRNDAKRFSENSGSTVSSSSDTLDAEMTRTGSFRGPRQRMSLGVQPRPKAVFYENGIVGIPQADDMAIRKSSLGMRPASAQIRSDSMLSRQSTLRSARQQFGQSQQRLSKCASDDTINVTAGKAREMDNEVEKLRQTVRLLESRNEMLTELVGQDPAIPEDVRLHMRTIELENAWLRRELARFLSPPSQ
ncbi:hypothetical protein LPJ55_004974 [Coemansia sp. RSA 990]|nr:hypothetical protein BX667DRAFT_503141 [Coemansia mojavensis]KAJ1739585.1 hypothetical protein LPJ68_004552 [Coemansia sp. RSA 1086]KAJ1870010.1 hypothetical protein LPJ55_004974 [Coemansia sp. RSA 990]KAJ2668074.1 hypothetical protein IWW42_005478 [Coemansia sp. RSA 1085]